MFSAIVVPKRTGSWLTTPQTLAQPAHVNVPDVSTVYRHLKKREKKEINAKIKDKIVDEYAIHIMTTRKQNQCKRYVIFNNLSIM